MPGKYNLLSISLAIIASLALGFVATTFIYSHNLLRLPGENPLQRMDRVLNLTPAERMQIGEVMEQTRPKMMDARRDYQKARRKLLIDTYVRIRAILTPQQQEAFDREFVPPGFRYSAEHPNEPGETPPPLEPPHDHPPF